MQWATEERVSRSKKRKSLPQQWESPSVALPSRVCEDPAQSHPWLCFKGEVFCLVFLSSEPTFPIVIDQWFVRFDPTVSLPCVWNGCTWSQMLPCASRALLFLSYVPQFDFRLLVFLLFCLLKTPPFVRFLLPALSCRMRITVQQPWL